MTTKDQDAVPSFSWHGIKFRAAVNLGTVVAVILFLFAQSIWMSWQVSGAVSVYSSRLDVADRDISEVKGRLDKVERAQTEALAKYAEITEKLGKLAGQNDSILAMLRDLQADRRMRPDYPQGH